MSESGIRDVTILHEYGAPRHFEALYYLQRQGVVGRINSVEFGLHRRLAMALLGRHPGWLRRCLHALHTLPPVLAKQHQTIILFAAPYDPVVPLFQWLKSRNSVVFWTSWPHWDGDRYPREPLYRGQIHQWHRFLEGTRAVTVTKVAQDAVIELGARAVHIPHCVDTSLYTPPRLPRDSSKTRILYVGRLHWEKGVHLLIDIAREGPWDDAEYWFVGDGNLKRAVQNMAKECGGRYFGYVKDQRRLAQIYAAADLLVLPSRKTKDWEELFGITLIEAMASGLPVVATDCVGPQEIVDDGVTGFVVRQGSKQELVDRIDRLVQDPDARAAMGQAGRRQAVAKYDVASVAQAWLDVLASLERPD